MFQCSVFRRAEDGTYGEGIGRKSREMAIAVFTERGGCQEMAISIMSAYRLIVAKHCWAMSCGEWCGALARDSGLSKPVSQGRFLGCSASQKREQALRDLRETGFDVSRAEGCEGLFSLNAMNRERGKWIRP